MSELISLRNPVFVSYCFYGGILCFKTLLMSLLTGTQRFRKKVFCSPEDATRLSGATVRYDDGDVERVRRAHLNDLENILPFLISSWIYLLTNPLEGLAVTLFRVFTVGRILHTFVYAVYVVPQPARMFTWAVAYGITIYMAVHSIIHFSSGY